VTAGSTNSGANSGGARPVSAGADKGKRVSGELEDVRPKVISPELRGLLSRKVEVLPRKVVRKTGEGLSSLSAKDKK
jgi:TBC1 domain family member 15